MMRRRVFRLALLALAACGPASVPAPRPVETPHEATEDAPPPPWPFADTVLPAPPAQGKPTDPGPRPGLPEGLVHAAEMLFRLGIADPRGLPYHEVAITLTTQPEGPGETVATKGFVLPGPEGGPRFGVLWNGLVYPLVSVGRAADLRADVQSLRASDKHICEKLAAHLPEMPCSRTRGPRPEIHSHKLEQILPMHAAILVQLGEDALARSLWQTWIAGGGPDDTPEVSGRERDIFERLAGHFLEVLRDRGLWAHVRGDDSLALASLRGLARLAPALSARAPVLASREPTVESLAAPPGLLLADQEMRAARKAPKGLPEPLPAEPAARVAALVAALGEVREPVFGRPGSQGQVLADPILRALLAEGEAAVLPLAEALSTDERYTRSIWYEAHGIVLFTVRDVAEIALDTLAADLPLAPAPPDETRPQKAERFKQAAEKFQSIPADERWYRELADETAGPARWGRAAMRIVGPTDAPLRRSDASDFLALFVRVDGPPKPHFAGLSSRKNPSVTELLARRMKQLAAGKAHGNLRASCEMGVLLALWDPKGAARPLREIAETLRKGANDDKDADAADELRPCLSVLFVARGASGDEKAFDEYASWIREIDPATVPLRGATLSTLLAPLALRPTRPSIVASGRAMFGAKTSPWALRFRRGERDDLLDPDLLPIPGMRELVLAALEDRTAIGAIELDAYGEATWGRDGDGEFDREHEQVDPRDPGAAASNTKMPLRACDRFAGILARRIDSAAPFRMYWIEPRRDDAIAALRAFVVTKSEPPRAP
ncbi:hypothetical protein [Polyangium sp. 6x1]|uniref:hypothetical protein n=1 Tax=Polyangium sp. 6x1 TaxID=3042689 RepID=UPI002482A38B|nr:hypothetical protein [Polyangium sp. 6x1]MDI1451002.1 hypothetical protein [Polyangium sp. 6x1]